MSVLFLNAYKVKRRDQLWPLLKEIKARGRAEVVQKLKVLYWNTMIQYDTEDPRYQEALRTRNSDWGARLDLAEIDLLAKFKEQNGKQTRDFFDLDVEIAIYTHASGFYLIAYCDNVSCLQGSLDFLRRHPALSDFHYQNRTDRPEAISARNWNHRRKVWTEIMTGHVLDAADAVVQVASFNHWWCLNPRYDLARKWYKNPPIIPTREQVAALELKRKGISVKTSEGYLNFNHGEAIIRKGRSKWTVTLRNGPKRGTRVATLKEAVGLVEYEYLPPALQKAVLDHTQTRDRK